MILWHLVDDARDDTIESPLDAKYWIATLDRKLIRYDIAKYANNSPSIVSCLDPSAIARMLQFWLPRQVTLDRAILGFNQLPLTGLDDEDVKASAHRLMDLLSRSDNVEELGEELMTTIYINDALRTKIGLCDVEDEAIELVTHAIATELEKSKQELDAFKNQAEQASAANIALSKTLSQERIEKNSVVSDNKAITEENTELIGQIAILRGELETINKREKSRDLKKRTASRIFVTLLSFVTPLLLAILYVLWHGSQLLQLLESNIQTVWLIMITVSLLAGNLAYELLESIIPH